MWRSRRTWTAVAARWPPCWCSAARCASATRSSPATPTAASAAWSTSTARTSTRRCRRGRCRSSASRRCRAPATTSWSSTRTGSPARSPTGAVRASATRWPHARRKRISLEDLDAALKETSQLNLILKGDNSGTVEALEDALLKHRGRRRGRAARHRPRCRWRHRDQRQPGVGVGRDHHRASTSAPRARPPSWPTARAWRSATTR